MVDSNDLTEFDARIGNPWSILPIKNKKYAKDMVEVHLSDRRLNSLEKFEEFPNLEVIWLNNNKLRNLDDISTNFRVKELYCQNNSLSSIEGIRRFKFLQVLLIGDNQLRDLDVFLEFLSKFAFLEQLDLFGNPLAEEPDYRLKIIKAMPQIKTLDRHKVTQIERTKADALAEQAIIDAQRRSPMKPKKAQQQAQSGAMKGFSKGEKDLYAEVRRIKNQKEQTVRDELERTQAYFQEKSYDGQPLPVPSKKAENRARFGLNQVNALTEWEKNQIRPIFREYAEGKKGVTKEQLVLTMARLATDECIIGKIPDVAEADYEGLFADWQTSDDELISWHYFAEGCNQWAWRFVDAATLNATIEEFFAKSHKLKMQGKETESREMASRALRLQGSLSKAKPIEMEAPTVEKQSKRGDVFFRTVLRRENNVAQDDAFDHTKTLDKTQTHKFRV